MFLTTRCHDSHSFWGLSSLTTVNIEGLRDLGNHSWFKIWYWYFHLLTARQHLELMRTETNTGVLVRYKKRHLEVKLMSKLGRVLPAKLVIICIFDQQRVSTFHRRRVGHWICPISIVCHLDKLHFTWLKKKKWEMNSDATSETMKDAPEAHYLGAISTKMLFWAASAFLPCLSMIKTRCCTPLPNPSAPSSIFGAAQPICFKGVVNSGSQTGGPQKHF